MPSLTFYPLGNANTCRIDLADGRKLLIDYADNRNGDRPERCDLPLELRRDLDDAGVDAYEVAAFTHLDNDHVCGASKFFWFEHARTYQGGDRIHIREMWVPAAAITEEGCGDDARVIQAEARHRLLEGRGIRVFSRPERLAGWLNDHGLSLDSRRHCIVDAGQLVPTFTLEADGVEFFVHSPFAVRQNANEVEDRNCDAIAFQARFSVDGRDTRVLMLSDLPYEDIAAFVRVTQSRRNDDRLEWDVCLLPHHCSYLSLGPEKGSTKTEPDPDVRLLYDDFGQPSSVLVSSSERVESRDCDQPPHFQAANYYREAVGKHDGEWVVTMEHPSVAAPEPLVIQIDGSGARREKRLAGAAAVITSRPAPRAG